MKPETLMSRRAASILAHRAVSSSRVTVTFLMTRFSRYTDLVSTPAYFPSYLALWRKAEDVGLDWASAFDHFLPIFSDPEGRCFDGQTLLAAMAAHTSRLRCGTIVTGVTYRHPAVRAIGGDVRSVR